MIAWTDEDVRFLDGEPHVFAAGRWRAVEQHPDGRWRLVQEASTVRRRGSDPLVWVDKPGPCVWCTTPAYQVSRSDLARLAVWNPERDEPCWLHWHEFCLWRDAWRRTA